MALKKLYYSVGGEIIAEKTAGGQRVDYLADALGSVMGTVNQSAQMVNSYRYKPYGVQLAKSGVGNDPSFLWLGNAGFRTKSLKYSNVFVRIGHYELVLGALTASHKSLELRSLATSLNRIRMGQPWTVDFDQQVTATAQAHSFTFTRVPGCNNLAGDQNCHQIYGIPPRDTCPSYKDLGCTQCGGHKDPENVADWLWSLSCVPKGSCQESPVKAHETRHQRDLNFCCARFRACWVKSNNFDAESCKQCFGIYFDQNKRWRECRGFYVGILAAKLLWDWIYNCPHVNPTDSLWTCCSQLRYYMASEAVIAQADFQCGTKNWLSEEARYDCPFDGMGNIDKSICNLGR